MQLFLAPGFMLEAYTGWPNSFFRGRKGCAKVSDQARWTKLLGGRTCNRVP